MSETNIYDFIGAICTQLGYNYQHGSYKAIQKYLDVSLDNKEPKSKRFPIVCLITEDLVQDVEVNPSQDTSYPLHIVIATYTKQNYTEAKRLEESFKAVLWPMYNAIIDKLRRYSKNEYKELPHKKQDQFFFSTNDNKKANKLGYILDAVELTGLNILLNFREFECNN